jgi:glycosyltransferase involved in cell wall biosynthesis
MEGYPLISVVVPSYNQGRYIEQTILSVLRQDYPAIELIVADGGSTDETVDILHRYPGIIWSSELDRGFADGVNKGLKRASGEICAIQSSDDLYRPGIFRLVAEAFADGQLNIVTGGMILIDSDGHVLDAYYVPHVTRFDYARFLRGEYYIPQPSTFFRRKLLDRVGYLNIDMNAGAEADLWVRILKAGPERLKYCCQPLSFYRCHEAQMTQTPERAREFANSFKETVRLSFPPGDPFYQDALRGAHYVSCHFLRQGGLRRALLGELLSLLFHKPSFFLDNRFRAFVYAFSPRTRRVVEPVFRRLLHRHLIDVPDHDLPADAFAEEEFDPKWMYRSEVKAE